MPDSSRPNTLVGLLDDADRFLSCDPGDMHGAIAGFPDQLSEAESLVGQVDWTAFKPTTPAGIAVCGMGGSAIGGDLVHSYWEPVTEIPMTVIRQEHLPAAINRFWLIIASSYSGNTAETLAAIREAAARRCRVLAITTGGELQSLARTNDWPLITLPGGLSPRAALGYSFGPLMLALARWGATPDPSAELRAAVEFLKSRCRTFVRGKATAENTAKRNALLLKDRVISVCGTAGTTAVIARRIKCQLCENAKALAFASTLPEWNHNEIVGFDAAADPERHAMILLHTGDDDPVARQRLMWIERLCKARSVPLVRLAAAGGNRLERMLSLVQEGDFISYYLAIATGQDPTPIPAIDDQKSYLNTVR